MYLGMFEDNQYITTVLYLVMYYDFIHVVVGFCFLFRFSLLLSLADRSTHSLGYQFKLGCRRIQ